MGVIHPTLLFFEYFNDFQHVDGVLKFQENPAIKPDFFFISPVNHTNVSSGDLMFSPRSNEFVQFINAKAGGLGAIVFAEIGDSICFFGKLHFDDMIGKSGTLLLIG